MAAPLMAAPDAGDGKLWNLVWQRYNTGLRSRQRKERDWYIAKEFFRGNQYHVWIDGRGITEPPTDDRSKRKPRLVHNKCRTSVETILAYLLKNEPAFMVMPNTGESKDQAAALASRRILYHYYSALSLAEKVEQAGLWAFITGAGLWKIRWNTLAGPQMPTMAMMPMEGSPEEEGAESPDKEGAEALVGDDGLEIPQMGLQQTGSMPGGDIAVDVVSPFEFVPDPAADSLENCRWVIHATMVGIDEMTALYPGQKFTADGPEGQSTSGFASRALQKFGGVIGGGYPNKQQLNEVLRLELWERSTKPGQPGRRIVATRKNGVLESGPTPAGYDEIPFAMWCDRVVPGEFWPDGTLRGVIPLQKELNKRLSQLVDIANKFKTKWTAMEGSVDESQINDEDGEVIEWKVRAPEAHAPPPMPEVPVQMVKMTSEFIDDETGAIAVLQGRSEGEQRSGRQVAYQGQYGETRLNRLAARMARFLERAGKLILMQAEANIPEQRAGAMCGAARRIEVFYFKGADIAGNNSVTVEVGSLLGFTANERFDKLVTLHRDKVITDDKFLSALEIADFYPLVEDRAQDRNNALQENEQWRQGQPARQPVYFENHMEHLRIHDGYRKSQEYFALPDQFRMIVDAHCHQHEDFLRPPAPMGGPPGAPPGPGGPPPGESPGMAASIAESGPEIAQGLPLVPGIPSTGPEQPPG